MGIIKLLIAVLLCLSSTYLYTAIAIYVSGKPDNRPDIRYRRLEKDENQYNKNDYPNQDSSRGRKFLTEQLRDDEELGDDDDEEEDELAYFAADQQAGRGHHGGSVGRSTASWGHFVSPWETPLFQWMEDPSLTHLPLPHMDPRDGHGGSRTVGYASPLRGGRRHQPSDEHPGLAASAQHGPQAFGLSRQRADDDDDTINGDDRRRHQRRGQTQNLRHRGGVGQQGQPARRSRPEEAGGLADLRRHRPGPYGGQASNAATRRANSDQRSGRRPEGAARPEGAGHSRKGSREQGRGGKPDRGETVRGRAPSLGVGQSVNTLPHSADQIVYKLPSETPPRQQWSPVLYESSARRARPVTTDFVSLSRLAEGAGGRSRRNRNRTGSELPRPQRRPTQHPTQVTRPRSSPEPSPASTTTPRPQLFRGRTGETVSPSRWNVDGSRGGFESRGQHKREDRWNEGESSPAPGTTRPSPGAEGHSGGQQRRRDEDDSSCTRQLDTCRRTELEYRRLRKAYQQNLESLKLLLVQVLDRFITNPDQLHDEGLCNVLGASATTSQRSGRHDVNRNHDLNRNNDVNRNHDVNRNYDVNRNHDVRRTLDHPLTHDSARFDGRRDHEDLFDRNVNGKEDSDDDSGDDWSDLRGLFEEGLDLADTDSGLVRSAVDHRVGQDDDVNYDYGEDEETGLDKIYDEEDKQQVWESWRKQQQAEAEVTRDETTRACELGAWTDWSTPVGFGVIERRRYAVTGGEKCQVSQSQGDLVMRVDISVFNANHTYYKAPDQVGEDFEAGFTRSHQPRDLLLVLDASGSIEEEDFELMREGVDAMVDLFCGGFGPNENNNRLAIILFASQMDIIHKFSDDQSPETLHNVIANMTQPNGNTCTGDALQLARDVIFSPEQGARPHVIHDTLLVTDGHSNCGEITVQEGAQLLQNVSNVFALGIGLANDTEARWELNSVVSDSDPRHIFSLERFQDFKDMLFSIRERQQTLPCLPIVDVTSAPGGRGEAGEDGRGRH